MKHSALLGRPVGLRGVFFLLLAVAGGGACTAGAEPPDDPRKVGQTDFTTLEPTSTGRPGASAGAGGSSGVAPAAPGTDNGAATRSPAPAGRVADVQEADIYKLSGTRLFYFNTYRGFLVYDVTDP
jgi:hypothetical protein